MNQIKPTILALLSAIGIVILFLLYILYLPYLSADPAQYISMAQMILRGAIPYVTIVDVNPPMIIYISMIPVLVSFITGFDLSVCSLLFFYFLILVTGFMLIASLKIALQEITQTELYLFFVFWILLAIFIFKQRDFAQREHLIFLFLVSFIIIRKARYDGRLIPPIAAIPSAIGAALVFTMKPQYLLPVAVIEAYFLARSKKFDAIFKTPESYTIVIFGVIYLVHFFIVPGMDAFFDYWLPTIARGYAAYNNSWMVIAKILFHLPLSMVNLVLILFISLVMIFQPKSRDPLSIAFIILGLCSLVIYLAQRKGWLYQSFVFQLGSLMGVAFFIRHQIHSLPEKTFIKDISKPFLMILPLIILSGIIPIRSQLFQSKVLDFSDNDLSETIKTLTQPEDNILILSAYVSNMYPWVTYTGRLSAGRFLTSFPITFFLDPEPIGPKIRDEWIEDERIYYSALLEDMEKGTPHLVFVDTTEDVLVYSYLAQRGFFETALQEFICIGEADIFMVYINPDDGNNLNPMMRYAIEELYNQEYLTKKPGCQLP